MNSVRITRPGYVIKSVAARELAPTSSCSTTSEVIEDTNVHGTTHDQQVSPAPKAKA